MEVAKKRYIETIHPGGPAFQENVLADDGGTHWPDEDSVCSDRNCTRSCGQAEEFSPVDLPRGQTLLRCRLLENAHLLEYPKASARSDDGN
jgi:hypothetical protein